MDNITLALAKSYTDKQTSLLRTEVGIDQLFELQSGKNILIPDSESGYYDTNTLEKKASIRHLRTTNPIPIESGHSLLTNTTDLTSATSDELFCLIWLDDAGNLIRATSQKILATINNNNGYIAFEIPSNATAFLAWISGVNTSGATLANFSLQYDNRLNATFIPYEPPETVIKKQHLPYGVQPLYGKTIVNFGDSIFGNYQFPNDISTEIAKLTGATVHNCGFGGCQMSEHSIEDYKPFSMCKLADAITTGDFTTQDEKANGTVVPSYFKSHVDLLKSIDFTDVDIVTIAYGTNDFTSGDALENADNNKDATKFAGALRYSIETLLNTYPHLKIFVCSQTYRFWYDDSGNFSEDSDTKTFSSGLKLTDFVEKTKEVAEEYHLPFVNNYNIGMNKYNRSVYFSSADGTHPKLVGRHLIASHIAKELF